MRKYVIVCVYYQKVGDVIMILGQGGAHYFYYKGEYYGQSTKFARKKEFVGKPTPHRISKKFWSEYSFAWQSGDRYFFNPVGCRFLDLTCKGYSREQATQIENECSAAIALNSYELEIYIGEILTPEKKMTGFLRKQIDDAITNIIEHPKRDWDYPELLFLWILYIVLMIGSLIFKQFYLLWIVLTLGFYYIRKNIRK